MINELCCCLQLNPSIIFKISDNIFDFRKNYILRTACQADSVCIRNHDQSSVSNRMLFKSFPALSIVFNFSLLLLKDF